MNIVGSSAPKFRTVGQRDKTYGVNGIISTLIATDYKQPKQIINYEKDKDKRIRKLTPLECWRAQGFNDKCFNRAKNIGVSDSSLYKLIGNSITVNVLYWNLLNLYKGFLHK